MCWYAAVTTPRGDVYCGDRFMPEPSRGNDRIFCDAQAVGDDGYWSTQAQTIAASYATSAVDPAFEAVASPAAVHSRRSSSSTTFRSTRIKAAGVPAARSARAQCDASAPRDTRPSMGASMSSQRL
jgi:hypothetical protein